MMNGIQEPMVVYTTNNTSTTGMTPSYTTDIRMPYQITPVDISKYLIEMDFIHTTSKSGDLWMRKNTGEYFTWEQAVTYCLIKPFLNP